MERRHSLDAIDRGILRILSTYQELTPLQLWYELGEDDAVKETLTDAEVLSRLESLRKKGFVETVTKPGVDADSSLPLYRMIGVDLIAIDGFDVLTLQTIISEVGLDMTRWPTEKHFASWLGLCPNNKVTGRAACAFRMVAQAAGKSHSALGAYYRRMKIRLGPSKAVTALAARS